MTDIQIRAQEAKQVLKRAVAEALEKKRRVLGDEHPTTLNAIHNMGFLLQTQGKHGEAEGYSREALEGRRKVLPAGHSSIAASLTSLGSVLIELGRYVEAEALLLESHKELRPNEAEIPAAYRATRLREVLELIVQLYDAWHAAETDAGHNTHAASWRAELQREQETQTTDK